MFSLFGLSSEPVMFFYTLIYVSNLQTIPILILKKECLQQNFLNASTCKNIASNNNMYQQNATRWLWLITGIQYGISFFLILLLGPLTDRIGRKKGFLLAPTLNLLQSSVYLLNSIFMEWHPLYILPGAIISSLYSDIHGIMMLCYSHVADKTNKKIMKRTFQMTIIEVGYFTSHIISGIYSGYIAKKYGFHYVYAINIAVDIILFLYVITFIHEYHKREITHVENEQLICESDKVKANGANALENLRLYGKIFHISSYLKDIYRTLFGSNRRFNIIVLTYCLCNAVSTCVLLVFPLYLENSPFHFSSLEIGVYVAYNGLIQAIGVFSFAAVSYYFLKLSDFSISIISLSFQILWLILDGIGRNKLQMYLISLVGILSSIAPTALRSAMSKQHSELRHGTTMSILMAFEILTSLIVSFVGLSVYQGTVRVYTGMVFFILSGVIAIALTIFLIIVKLEKLSLREKYI